MAEARAEGFTPDAIRYLLKARSEKSDDRLTNREDVAGKVYRLIRGGDGELVETEIAQRRKGGDTLRRRKRRGAWP